jgi:hypothetical protein
MKEDPSLFGRGRNLLRTLVGLLITFLAAVSLATPYFVWRMFFAQHSIWPALLIAMKVALGLGAFLGALIFSIWVICLATPQLKRFVAWLVPKSVVKACQAEATADLSKPQRPSAAEATPEPPEEDIDSTLPERPSCSRNRPWLMDRSRFGRRKR